MVDITNKKTNEILTKAQGKKFAVIGDVMLDKFYWGSVSRVSPEAPVPVIDIDQESFHLGGAANVANNLTSLGLNPILCGIIGTDNSGKRFKELAEKSGISCEGIFVDVNRPTTVKTRIIGNNQHIARLDREIKEKISNEGELFILNTLKNNQDLSGVIFEDYNKGVVSPILIREVIAYCKKNEIPVYVDPKYDNFFDYHGVTVFKPNRKEAQQALNMKFRTKDDILNAGKRMLHDLKCENVLMTLGADGMMLFESNGEISSVPTNALHVSDVSGAGDTAIATMATTMAGGATIKEAALLANLASGFVCEMPGIVSITIDGLKKSLSDYLKLK